MDYGEIICHTPLEKVSENTGEIFNFLPGQLYFSEIRGDKIFVYPSQLKSLSFIIKEDDFWQNWIPITSSKYEEKIHNLLLKPSPVKEITPKLSKLLILNKYNHVTRTEQKERTSA